MYDETKADIPSFVHASGRWQRGVPMHGSCASTAGPNRAIVRLRDYPPPREVSMSKATPRYTPAQRQRKRAKWALCLSALLLCAGCISRAHRRTLVRVSFWDRDRAPWLSLREPGKPYVEVVRAYLDASGRFYPRGARRDAPGGDVVAHFEGVKPGESVAPPQQQAVAELKALLQHLIATHPGAPLYVLIHGFNVADASSDFRLAETLIRARHDTPIIVLEVHWDGGRFKRELWHASQWSQAQVTAVQVGMGLRAIVSGLQSLASLRVLTHSLGALVGATLVGDSTGVFAAPLDEPAYSHMTDSCGQFAVANHATRLAVLAPATGTYAFIGNPRSTHRGVLAERLALMIGVNPEDSVLLKRDVPLLGAPGRLGWTVLGTGGPKARDHGPVQFSQTDELVKAFKARSPAQSLSVAERTFDEEGDGGCTPTDHDFYCYLTRPKMGDVLQFLTAPGR
jgi:hypothetical protein